MLIQFLSRITSHGNSMHIKIKDLLKIIETNDLSPDAEVWIEYPERYGLAQPSEILEHFGDEDQDMIPAMSVASDKKRLYIYHHF